MKLKRLIVHGFKSFRDRTTIHFDTGITGIVGPNGCGKSNIVDALFWVMGEQSAKHLRGNTMKDVIFAGSSKYNPGSFAEASLVLENTEGKHIHIGQKVASPSEIQLTRKLYRNGESEYRINNTPCRLKDIQEVFMDTGAGAKSYSIIAQGEINRLVQAKPVERRVMIEEVAGITKFKAKRRESLRKIEQTQMNLNRLSDLQNEIEKNLKSLQKQAERAERAKNLREKVKRNELIHFSHKVYFHLKTIKEAQEEISIKSDMLEEMKSDMAELESSLKQEREERKEKDRTLEKLQSDYHEEAKSLAAAEEKLKYLCQTLSQKESWIEEKKRELEQIALEQESQAKLLEDLERQKDDLGTIEEQNSRLNPLQEMKEEKQTLLEKTSERYNELEQAFTETSQRRQALENERERLKNRIEDGSQKLQDMTAEMDDLEEGYSTISKKLSDEREQVESSRVKFEELTKKEKEVSSLHNEMSGQLKDIRRENEEAYEQLMKKEALYESLLSLNESLEGLDQGTQKFVETFTDYGILGQFIECDQEYVPVLSALAKKIQHLIFHKERMTELPAGGLGQVNEGSFRLLLKAHKEPCRPESLERLKVFFSENLRPIADVLRFKEGAPEELVHLFSGHYIVPEIDPDMAKELSEDLPFLSVANMAGTMMVHNEGNKIVFERLDQSRNEMLERNNKLKLVCEELESLKSVYEEVQERFEKVKLEEAQKSQECIEVKEALMESRGDYTTRKSSLESKLESYELNKKRLQILKDRKEKISSERLEMLESLESSEQQLKALATQKNNYEGELHDVRNRREELTSELTEIKEQVLSLEVEVQNFEKNKTSLLRQQESILAQQERLKEKQETLIGQVEKRGTELEEMSQEISDLEAENDQMAVEIESKSEALKKLKNELKELSSQMSGRENQLKDLSRKSSQYQKDISKLEVDSSKALSEEEQVVRNIFERYHIDLREILTTELEFKENHFVSLHKIDDLFEMETEKGSQTIEKVSYDFQRKYGQDLKDSEVKFRQYKTELNRLGEINWQAVEDYDHQKLRRDFLREQENELRRSLEDLEKAIAHIDYKSQERFKHAFKEVSSRFERVFPIIFGGGSAKLQLTGPIDDPECGVDIVAQPPGKKMQNINLMSGGEKALTAVSLIFSIFLVKPSPFCLLDEVDAPLDDANVGRFNELLREMSDESQFILITHNKKTMELNDTLYGVTMQEPGISTAVSVQLH